jgi:repressor LexA
MTRKNGYAPTIRELMEDAGLSSTNAVAGHLLALERKGLVTSLPGKARTLRVTATAQPFLNSL